MESEQLELLEVIIRQFLDTQITDEELIALRNVLGKMDEATAIKIASASVNPKILCDLMPSIGPSWPRARKIAEKRLKQLFPREYEKYQRERYETRGALRSMIRH